MKNDANLSETHMRDIEESELPPPTGTIVVLTVYLVALAGMWGAMYLLMLAR